MNKEEVEQIKARMILGQQLVPSPMSGGMGGGGPGGGSAGQNAGSSPLMTPPFGAVMKQHLNAPQAPAKPPMGSLPPMPQMQQPPPAGKMLDPRKNPVNANPGAIAPHGSVTPESKPQSNREKEVRRSLENLRAVVMELGATIYQMPLTEEQVRDLAYKMLETAFDRFKDITTERVQEIGHDLLGEIITKKKYN